MPARLPGYGRHHRYRPRGEIMRPVRRVPAKLVLIGTMIATAVGGLFLFDTLRKRAAIEAAQANTEIAAVAVVVRRIDAKASQQTIDAVGTVVADQQVLVASETAGRVTRIHFESGEIVKAGAPLLQVNNAAKIKELERYRATAQLAQFSLERAKRLNGQSMSRAEYEQHVAAYDESNALVAQTEAELALRLVRAPFAGELGIRRVNLGQYVEAGTPIATLTNLDTLHVDFAVPERYRSMLFPGLQISLVGEVTGQPTVQGRITSIDSQVDATHRTASVRATLSAEGRRHLWPGAFARVRVQLPEGEAMLHVPSIAISHSLSGQSLFVIRKDQARDVARLMPIQVGENHGGDVAVKAGELRAGDLVVVAGQINLRDNTPVTLRIQGQDGEALDLPTAEGE